MNETVKAVAVALASSLLLAVPALAATTLKANGSAQNPSNNGATSGVNAIHSTDPGHFRGIYSPGYGLINVSTGANFAGMDWPETGAGLLKAEVPNLGTPDLISLNFEVPTGSLVPVGTPPNTPGQINPQLSIVVQDTNSDYFQSKRTVTTTYLKSSTGHFAGYDLMELDCNPATDFNAINAEPLMAGVNKYAAVWIGYAALAQGDGNPPSLSELYITNPTIVKGATSFTCTYSTDAADLEFNFQTDSANNSSG